MAPTHVMIKLVLLLSNTGLFLEVLSQRNSKPNDENCVMSFVIPRDKVKSSCQMEGKVNRRLNSMEMKLNMYRREVTALQTQLQKERQLCHDKLQTLEGKMATFDSDSRYYALEKKLENLEAVLKKGSPSLEPVNEEKYRGVNQQINRGKSGNKKTDLLTNYEDLTIIVKPIVISEIENYLDNFTTVLQDRGKETEVENNKIMNMWPRNDQSYTERKVKVNETKARDLIDELENLQNKLNKTGDELVATVGNLLKNVTIRGDSVVYKQNKTYVGSGSADRSNMTGLNDTQAAIHPDVHEKEVIHKKDKVTSRISVSEGGNELQNDQDTDNNKMYANLYTDELEEILRGEINNLLQTRMEEVISLMRKQSSNLVNIVNEQGQEIDDLEEGNEERMKRLQDNVDGVKLEMSSLSSAVQELYGKLDKLQSLHVVVEEIKKNMSSASTSRGGDMARKVDEHGKKLRTLDRLYGIFQQSLQHYRNESKGAYYDMLNKVRNLETTLAKDVSTDLYVNVTSKVGQDLQRFNNTLKSKVNSMEAAIRNLEDNSVLFQMDIKNLERRHKSKIGKLEVDYGSLKNRVDRLINQNRKLQESVSGLKTDQRSQKTKLNSTSSTLQSLEIEFKLSITDSWVEYNFLYDTSRTECFGKQYIRKTKFRNGRLAGVVMCSNMRYKIMLANSVTDKFSNIGDVSGFGEDHCEFVGSTESSIIRLSPPAISMKTEEDELKRNTPQEEVFIRRWRPLQKQDMQKRIGSKITGRLPAHPTQNYRKMTTMRTSLTPTTETSLISEFLRVMAPTGLWNPTLRPPLTTTTALAAVIRGLLGTTGARNQDAYISTSSVRRQHGTSVEYKSPNTYGLQRL